MRKKLDDRYLQLVLDAVDQGIFTVNPEGLITSFNKASERITGYKEEEVLGRSCASVFRTNLCKTVCPLRQSIATRDRIQNKRARIRRKDGQLVTIAISTVPLETASNELLGGVEVFRDLSHAEALSRQLAGQFQFEDIVSCENAMRQLFQVLPLIAESDSTVLILGESGTGKELVAKALHNHGPRRRRPFVALSCAAVPETLLEAELFGYRRGAFTDAKRDRHGRIAQAEGGTLFLDEVGDLPPSLQVKLLRFLQERTYEPLGADASIHADVRLIAATHRNLEAMVEEGTFRKDLYFRLNVVPIELPPLRERPNDIPLLARHFVQRFREVTGKAIHDISAEAMAALVLYEFPGNIRELENLVERAFVLCTGEEIRLECLPPCVLRSSSRRPAPISQATGESDLAGMEAQAIRSALGRNGGNRTRAARELGIHRTTLLRKMARLRLR